jgi:uncharacterized protein (DUF488 family)
VIYTVGYGALLPNQLYELAEALDVTVVDVRGKPTSRRAGFGGRQLASLLGTRYSWRGDELGGVHHLADARSKWPDGLTKLAAEVERPLLLCQCHAPGFCHRHQLALTMDSLIHSYDSHAYPHEVVHLYNDPDHTEWEAIRAGELERSIRDGDEYDALLWSNPAELIAEFEAE